MFIANYHADPGMSGSWVIRDGKLCGIIYAAYDRSPYLHMIPAETVFADIKSFMGASTVEVTARAFNNDQDQISSSGFESEFGGNTSLPRPAFGETGYNVHAQDFLARTFTGYESFTIDGANPPLPGPPLAVYQPGHEVDTSQAIGEQPLRTRPPSSTLTARTTARPNTSYRNSNRSERTYPSGSSTLDRSSSTFSYSNSGAFPNFGGDRDFSGGRDFGGDSDFSGSHDFGGGGL